MKRRGTMRRSLAWLLSLVLCLGMLPGAALAAETKTASDLFISEYVEGSGSNKAVEIYNGTGQVVNLSQYTLVMVNFSGSSTPTKDASERSLALSGTLNDGETFVYYNSGIASDLAGAAHKESNNTVINFNGNDYVYLKKGDTIIDVIGGTSTSMNDYPYDGAFAADCTLVRNADVTGPSETYQEDQWTDQGKDALNGLGSHTMGSTSQPGGGEEDTTVAAPQADPMGGAVASGTAITLTCATADAQIYYTLDGSDPSDLGNENRQLYSASNQPVITEACTLKAVAVKDGVSSAVQSIDYTIQSDEPAAAPIAGGDQVVIYNPVYKKALSSEKTGFYNVGTDITVSEGTVSGYGENDVWTVVANADGTFSFQQDGKNIGLAESHSSMDLNATYDDWKLIDLGNGLYNIRNTGRGNYMEWYAQYSNWSTYNSSSAATDPQFQLSFYKVTGDIPEPEPEAPITAGDTVVIYAPSNNMALSAKVKNTYYPIGVEVTVEDGALTGYSNTEIWKVGGDAENGWTFMSNSGKTLSMADSYSSTYPGAGNNETWILESAKTAGQYYVKNEVRGTYLFWDDEHDDWTTRNDDKTAVTFVVVEPPEEEPDVSGLEVRATPASGASLVAGDTIELTAAAGTTIYYTTDGTVPTTSSTVYSGVISVGSEQVPAPTSGSPLVVKAFAVLPADEASGTEEQIGDVCTFTYKAPMTLDGYQLYFGQLHSHTNISDGAGTVEEAFAHAAGVDNLDFLAVTDHSNSFDNESDASVDLGADLTGVSSEWAQGHAAADAITVQSNGTFVGIYGFEMTWSDGFGHINTFNTPGFESRSNSEFGNKSGSTEGYQNYYNKLVEVESSLSQFNHPGTTFGDFQDFSFYDPQVDQRITLIEVGNGEGAIGSSGYFPSYEYYTRALDKGWHVAPTNNQDNHKGNWGDSNTARSVVLASSLTEDAIYDAIRNYRVYATEDNDLSILYSLNGNAMGSILNKQEDGVTITAQLSDPTDSGDMKVEVIVNGGLVADSTILSGGSGTVEFHFDSNDYSYYYLRITQADQNIAVTAPVWTGEGVNAGISATTCDTVLVVKDEEVNISSELFNNADSDMTVKSLIFSVDDKTIHTANVAEIGANGVIVSGGAATVSFPYAFTSAGKTTVDVTMMATIDGTDYTFTGVLQLTITDASLVTRVLVDGTHYNDYVNGYYAGNMGNFTQLAADRNAQVTIQQPGDPITAEVLEDVSLLVISAPIKYDQNGIVADESNRFSDDFVAMVRDYVQGGGTVIVCGLADYQDKNNNTDPDYTTYGQINKLLEGIGSTMKVNDDELIDQDENGGQQYRLYFDDFNYDSTDTAVQAALAGLEGSGKVYSSYSGCSVSVGNGTAIVYGHDTTYSINSKNPAQGHDKPVLSASAPYDESTAVVPKGGVVSLATEAVGAGRVYVGGTVWLSDFEVANSEGNDYGDASYANKTILENILSGLLVEQEVSTIAEARANTTVGTVFTVEGTITAGNVEPNAFYDTIYIQDETGGINIYPVATTDGTFRVGQKVRVTGSWDQYQGDTELRCISIELTDSTVAPITPDELTIPQAGDYDANGGLLAKVGGTVKSVEMEGDAISSAILTDGTNDFRLLFNNYIGYSDETSPDITTFVKEGAEISAVGVIYMDPEGVCLRVRDLSEVTEESSSTNTGSSSVTRYTITVEDADNGSVKSSMRRASRGTTVTLTATPDEGYELESITVTRSGGTVSLTDKGDGKYTFTMPRANVTVEAVFTASGEQPGDTGLPFTDVDADDWFHDAVTYVYENGMMEGTSDTAFSPSMTTTRGMIVTILWRLEDSPEADGQTGFTDVADGAWYADAVNWAAEQGIVEGYDNGGFGPGDIITREQMALILYRYAQYKGYDTSATGALDGFADAGAVSGWAEDAVAWAVGAGLMEGKGGDMLDPTGTATRAEAAAILTRFCQNIEE